MKIPKFLLADNSDFPDNLYVVHTDYPRFILDVDEEDVEWLDDIKGDNEIEMTDQLTDLIEQAYEFCDAELDKYEEEENEDV